MTPHEPALLRGFRLRQGIAQVPLIREERYRTLCPPLFPEPVRIAPGIARQLSIATYFLPREEDGGHWTITDDHPDNEAYHNRQWMLASVYEALLGDRTGATLLDVGGSNGYYSFHAARLGFHAATCIDGRPVHRGQLEALRELAGTPGVGFELVDVEDLSPLRGRRYDVVIAQGILHHLYDHLRFLRDVTRLARRLLIIDTHVTNTITATATMRRQQRQGRGSPVSSLSLTPSVAMLVELMRAAGCREILHVPWPGRIRAQDGSVVDVYGYRQMYRVMLVARMEVGIHASPSLP